MIKFAWRWGWLVAAFGVAAAFLWMKHAPIPAKYVTAAAERGSLIRAVTATGTVNPVVTVQVGTYVSGPIVKLYCDFNTEVKKGQICAKIDPRPYQVTVEQARANFVLEVRDRESDERQPSAVDQRLHVREEVARGGEDRPRLSGRVRKRVRTSRAREVVEAQAQHDRPSDALRAAQAARDPVDDGDEVGVDLLHRSARPSECVLRADRAPADA